MDNKINDIVNLILDDYHKSDSIINTADFFDQPDTDIIINMIDKLIQIIFPGFFNDRKYKFYNLSSQLTVILEDVM